MWANVFFFTFIYFKYIWPLNMALNTGEMATENVALPIQEIITFKKYIK